MFILANTVYITITKYIKQYKYKKVDQFIFMSKVSAFTYVPGFNSTELQKHNKNHNIKIRDWEL